ncbi:hypothetical protein ATR1_286c0001, partial [Acetobacter tropicalis]
HRAPEQGRSLRPAVPGRLGDDDDDRRRSPASGCPHRHHRRAAQLGFGADPPSPCAHDRAGWRSLARWP